MRSDSKMELDRTCNEEEQRVTALEWRPVSKSQLDQKQHGGEWLKTKGEQLGSGRARLSELWQQTEVDGKTISKPCVPYGTKRHRNERKPSGLPVLAKSASYDWLFPDSCGICNDLKIT